VAALATAAVALFRRGDRLPAAARAVMIVLVTTLALGHGLGQYRAWAADRRYTIFETSREIAPLVDDGLLAGLASPALSLENKTRVLYAFEPWFNYQETFARFPITHLVLGVYNGEVDWYWRKYPEEMRRAIPLRVYHLWRSDFYLFSMRPEDRDFFNRRPAATPEPLNAAVVGFTAPREMSAGEAARGSITFRNTGTAAWDASSPMTIASPRSRNPFGPNLLPATLDGAVRPGGEVTIPVAFTAPQRAGYYMTEYRLEDGRGQPFGDYAPIGILVR
jgi:hypothetical protein